MLRLGWGEWCACFHLTDFVPYAHLGSRPLKPYVCNFSSCSKRYKNLNGLKYHLEKTHQLPKFEANRLAAAIVKKVNAKFCSQEMLQSSTTVNTSTLMSRDSNALSSVYSFNGTADGQPTMQKIVTHPLPRTNSEPLFSRQSLMSSVQSHGSLENLKNATLSNSPYSVQSASKGPSPTTFAHRNSLPPFPLMNGKHPIPLAPKLMKSTLPGITTCSTSSPFISNMHASTTTAPLLSKIQFPKPAAVQSRHHPAAISQAFSSAHGPITSPVVTSTLLGRSR